MALNLKMDNPVSHILEELTWPGITQESVAITYAYIIVQEPKADWFKINAAIRSKWPSDRALKRIKTIAWSWVESWERAEDAR